jgi:membrane-bound lytic murein transglycosylase D
MKTMLNRKLVRTGLLTNGVLLLIAVVTTAGTLLPAINTQQPLDDSIQWVKFDRQFLQVSGLSETEAVNAPAITLNKQGVKFMQDYLSKNNSKLEKIKGISTPAFTIIDSVFRKYNLPTELKYLAVIESELNRKAVSKVGAVGTWQFMPATARLFSLKVTSRNDERTHLYKSTVAAARYLNDLYKVYGDWLLVIAAYNAGPGNVDKAIRRSGSRNFWKIQYNLPAETRGHVKKFISTHYYFEGEGGVTTLTKAETEEYTKKMIAFVAEQNTLIEEKLMAKNTSPVNENNPAGNDKIADIRSNAGLKTNEEEE